MRKRVLLGLLSSLVLTGMPGTGLAQGVGSWRCDPNGPVGAFVDGIPAEDNPVWCQTTRPGYGMATATEALPGQPRHARRLRHHH